MKQFSLKFRKILLYDFLYYIILFLSIIYLIIYNINFEVDNIFDKNDTSFELKILNYHIDGNKLTIEFDNLIGNYYFKSENEKNRFNNIYSLGDIIEICGTLSYPSNNSIPNTFNYKKYLNHKNIEYILSIENFKIKYKNKNIFLKLKNYLYKRIDNTKYNNYLYAFILGYSSMISEQNYNNYKVNGVTHLFALSGLHVSLFSSIFLLILNKLKFSEKSSFISTSLFLLLFSFIASFTPSILRASIFFILSGINKIYYLFIKPKYLLYLTFVILVIINPNYIFNTGFILSFTITFSILLFNENYKIDNKFKSILIISFISFLSSLPIVINMSYEINILGFLNNLFFIPYVSYIVFPCALICLIIPNLSFILNILINIMEFISKMSASILNISVTISKISVIYIIIYYLLFILIIKRKKKYKKYLLILLIIMYMKPLFNRNSYIYFIDVSQGDSALIITNNNKSILIDTGGKISYESNDWEARNRNYNLMINSMIPFFKSIGLKKIDYLILSHGDYDHMGGSINLVNNFKVKEVIFNCGTYNNLEIELIKILNQKKILHYTCIEELNVDDNKLSFLQTEYYDNENDNSNVIYTEIDGYKFMFMGDASSITEKEIMNKYMLSNIDVLKVGHHGSKTSSSKEFIDEMKPKYSIISVGKNNRYGHPNKEVLENLKNSEIYRTDEDGSIMFKFKNNKLLIETCAP